MTQRTVFHVAAAHLQLVLTAGTCLPADQTELIPWEEGRRLWIQDEMMRVLGDREAWGNRDGAIYHSNLRIYRKKKFHYFCA